MINCIVEVKCKKNNITLGTGFWVTHDGYVLTCWHVIKMCPDDLLILWKEQEYETKLCPEYSWPDEDIAVLKVPGKGFNPIPLGTHWKIGDNVWARGFQYYGKTNKGWRGYSVRGNIIGPGDYQDSKGKHEYIQINADVEDGLSGAMLFDEDKNRVVGIVSDKIRVDATSNKDFGAVIPVKKVFEKWPQLDQLNTTATQHVLIDFMPYIDRLIYDFEHYDENILNQREPIIPIMARCDLNKFFVSLRAIDSNGNEINPIDDYIAKWLQDSERRHVTILGDFGTGKSSYGLKLCYDLAKRYREDPVENPVPLFVQLGLFSKTKLQEFDHYTAYELLPCYGIKPPLFSFLIELCYSGKLLIFLDGFDEMSSNKDRQSIHRNFNELREAISRKSKSILTCRTNYFTHESEVTELFNPESGAGLEAQYELLQLREFNEEQIIAYLKRNAASKWEDYWESIKNNYDLPDLSRRPVLLHMIVKTLPQLIKPGAKINTANLYENYTRACLRKGEDRVTFMTRKKRETFMQELAFEMFIQWQENISLVKLSEKIGVHFPRLTETEFEWINRDVRTCTFLHRKSANDIYRFTHRTFMDYFVAQKLIRDLLENQSFESLGKRPLTPEICTFFVGLVENQGILEEIKEELLNFIEISKETDFDRKKNKYLASNAISLLNKMKVDLSDRDFSHTSLISANLTYTNLQHTNFMDADLEGAHLIGSNLCDCNLKNANIKDVYLGRPDEIRLVVYRPEGKYLLSAHSDNSIRLWNAHTGGELVHIKNAHAQKVNCVCFNPVKKYFASSSNDMLIKIWKYEEKDDEGISVDREPILELPGHRLSVESISFDPTGRYLFSGSYDHTARRWDLEQPINAKARVLEGHTNAVFSVNSDHEKYVVTGSWDKTVKIWQVLLTNTRCITLKGHTKPVFSVSVSPGQGLVASGSSDKSLRVWKLDSGEMVFLYDRHNGSVRHVCFSPTGLYLASGCWDSLVRVWRTNDWKLLFQLPGHGAPVWGVRFSPDETRLVSCDANGAIKIWRVTDGSLLKTIETSGPSLFLNFKSMNVTHLKGCSKERIEFFKNRGAIEEE